MRPGIALPVCLCAALSANLFAGQALGSPAGRCYAEPTLHPSNRERIAELTRFLANPSSPTRTQGCELFARGLLHHFDGEPRLAIGDYSRALGWMHEPASVHEMRGDAYEDAGQHEKAAADYAEAAKGNEDVRALDNLCWVRAVRGHPLDRALANCNAALRQRPDDTNAREARCLVHYRMGENAAAVSDCDAVLKETPHAAAALYIRGLAKTRVGDVTGGKADVAAAVDAVKETPEFFALWGVKP